MGGTALPNKIFLSKDLTLQNMSSLQQELTVEHSEMAELQIELAPQLLVDSAGLQFLIWLQNRISPSILSVTVNSEHSLLRLVDRYKLNPQFKLRIED